MAPKSKKGPNDGDEDDEEDDSDIFEGYDEDEQKQIKMAAAARVLAHRHIDRRNKKNKTPEKRKSFLSGL